MEIRYNPSYPSGTMYAASKQLICRKVCAQGYEPSQGDKLCQASQLCANNAPSVGRCTSSLSNGGGCVRADACRTAVAEPAALALTAGGTLQLSSIGAATRVELVPDAPPKPFAVSTGAASRVATVELSQPGDFWLRLVSNTTQCTLQGMRTVSCPAGHVQQGDQCITPQPVQANPCDGVAVVDASNNAPARSAAASSFDCFL